MNDARGARRCAGTGLADDAIELQRLTQSVTIENGVIAVLEYRMKFITL